MRFDTLIIGGGLAGLVAGISLQKAGRKTAIVSTGQNSLYFFSGTFESVEEPSERLRELLSECGIRVHYSPGVRFMPLGTFRDSALSLEDISLFPTPEIARKALIVNFAGYLDFFSSFISEGLSRHGASCRMVTLDMPELSRFHQNPDEMRSAQIARALDSNWEKVVKEVCVMLHDEDTVILPQVFGMQDAEIPEKIRRGIPARVIFTGTLPPSVPGIRTQMLLKRRYEVLGGTYLSGDEVVGAHLYEGTVHSVVTRNLEGHYLEAGHFILATGGYFSKGLKSNPFQVYEPLFGLDVDYSEDRNAWYDPSFAADQPYMNYGVKTDEHLHALLQGNPVSNLLVAGSVLGATHPELGSGAGLAIRSAFAAVDQILKASPDQA